MRFTRTTTNIQPRVGFAWDPFKDGKTSMRAAYAILADQPVTNLITGASRILRWLTPKIFATATNPGLRTTFSSALAAAAASDSPRPRLISNFENAYVQSWNLNVQREITPVWE